MSHGHVGAIVTGAAAGIGRELALGLLENGARVLAVDLDHARLDALAREGAVHGSRLQCVALDLCQPDTAAAVIGQAHRGAGGFNTLICNAGIGRATYTQDLLDNPPRTWEIAPHIWQRFFEVNALAAIRLVTSAVPLLLQARWGRIVCVTTSLDSMLNAGTGPYGPSKAALEAFCAVAGAELDGSGVTANVLIPGGPVDTAMIPPQRGLARSALLPTRIMLAPLLWLLSRQADGITCRRVRADRWAAATSVAQALESACAPVAWSALAAGQRNNPVRT